MREFYIAEASKKNNTCSKRIKISFVLILSLTPLILHRQLRQRFYLEIHQCRYPNGDHAPDGYSSLRPPPMRRDSRLKRP